MPETLSLYSITGLRKKAKKLQKKFGFKRSKALNKIANQYGFSNWEHLVHHLRSRLLEYFFEKCKRVDNYPGHRSNDYSGYSGRNLCDVGKILRKAPFKNIKNELIEELTATLEGEGPYVLRKAVTTIVSWYANHAEAVAMSPSTRERLLYEKWITEELIDGVEKPDKTQKSNLKGNIISKSLYVKIYNDKIKVTLKPCGMTEQLKVGAPFKKDDAESIIRMTKALENTEKPVLTVKDMGRYIGMEADYEKHFPDTGKVVDGERLYSYTDAYYMREYTDDFYRM